jgi:rod shape-determining protein MreD
MFASLVQGPLPRLVLVGIVLVALQQTLFVDLRPAGVTVQVVLAFAAAAGAASGPQKGALAGFVLGMMYDLRAGSPLGSSSIAMGLGGFVAGYSLSVTVDPQWWLAMLFTGLGAAVGEAAVPVVRSFIGEEGHFTPRLFTVIPVVTVAAMLLSPLFVPLGRWCMGVKKTDWTKVKAPE